MSNVRHDKLSQKTRKAHVCDWCHLDIALAAQMVRVSGIGDDGAFHAKFHPECWRAEYFWWKRTGAEFWPGEALARGRTDDQPYGPEFTDRPLTLHEVKHRYLYRDFWKAGSPAPQLQPS